MARQLIQTGVGKRAGSQVRLGFLPGLVSSDFDPRPGQKVEEGRLSGLRIAEQGEIHDLSKYRFHDYVKALKVGLVSLVYLGPQKGPPYSVPRSPCA